MSFSCEIHVAQISIEQYIGIWEDDIASSDLFHQDRSLRDKILNQLKQVDAAIVESEVKEAPALTCTFFVDVPITYNSLPAGVVRSCFSPRGLFVKALFFPLFSFRIFLALLVLLFGSRRDFRSRLQEQELSAQLTLSHEIEKISKQVAHDIRGPMSVLRIFFQKVACVAVPQIRVQASVQASPQTRVAQSKQLTPQKVIWFHLLKTC